MDDGTKGKESTLFQLHLSFHTLRSNFAILSEPTAHNIVFVVTRARCCRIAVPLLGYPRIARGAFDPRPALSIDHTAHTSGPNSLDAIWM